MRRLHLRPASVFEYLQKFPGELRADLRPFNTETWAVGIRQQDDALADEVNAFLKEFRASGGFDALAERYLGEQKEVFDAQGIPFVF
ncbi:MAG: transporter substrate-binding domain-containing protein [Verrucomicrobiales bacterium]